jgi:hypothetical protein
MTMRLRAFVLAVALAAGSIWSGGAHAASEAILLVRGSLANDTDSGASPSGLWQYEAGSVQNSAGTATIGHYIANRRVTTAGTLTDNTAGMTITLFFSTTVAANVPHNVTLEGAWSFTSGQFAGSVSAASGKYHWIIGADATGAVTTTGTTRIVLEWPGMTQLHLP